jgi:hypothetical protein
MVFWCFGGLGLILFEWVVKNVLFLIVFVVNLHTLFCSAM